jgi:single-strand DNA-binding protein
MRGVNKVILLGTCGQDPDARTTASGDPVTVLSLATNEQWLDKRTGEKVQRTEWHRVVLFGKVAEIAAKYLSKGAACYVEGQLKTREWEKDGVKRYTTEVVVNVGGTLQLIGGSGSGGNSEGPRPGRDAAESTSSGAGGGDFDDEIPFSAVPFLAGV